MINNLALDRDGSFWPVASSGFYCRRPDQRVEYYTARDGLPDDFVETVLDDRQGAQSRNDIRCYR